MHTSRYFRFLALPHVQLCLLAVTCLIWGQQFASREALIADDTTHWFWPHVYGYMAVAAIVEAFIYWMTARFLQWPWLHHLHVATMTLFAVAMWSIEMIGDMPNNPALPLTHTLLCLTQYLLLAGHLAFFTHISAGMIIGRKATA